MGHGIEVDTVANAFLEAVQDAISTNQQNGFPIAKYDTEKNSAYLELPDGSREYVNE